MAGECMNKREPRSQRQRARALIFRLGVALVFGAMVIVAANDWRVRAQTNRFVSTSGDDQGGGNDCSNSGQPCKTIQNAVNHSGGGDEIDLGPGTYVENVTVSQSVTIRGDAGAGSTVDGNHAGSVLATNGSALGSIQAP
jgi:hypothetical protein